MVKRNSAITHRNIQIKKLTTELKSILPAVLIETGIVGEQSLNALAGGKNQTFADVYNTQILTPDEYVSIWSEGFERESIGGTGYQNLRRYVKSSKLFRQYLMMFLKRTFLRNFDSLSRARPNADDAYAWIGDNRASYGIFVTPRFVNGQWENDRSEVRHFPKKYWTIGHVLKTGLVVPSEDRKIEFTDVKQYLNFFIGTLVRNSSSPHEMNLAKRYEQYVLNAENQEDVPLLIPEYRFGGIEDKHEFRLDFSIFTEGTAQSRVGFELSPWSSHGHLAKIKGLTQKEINEMASNNFEKEMEKHKAFFQSKGIIVQIFTDQDLANMDIVFNEVKRHLEMPQKKVQLNFETLNSVFGEDLVNSSIGK